MSERINGFDPAADRALEIASPDDIQLLARLACSLIEYKRFNDTPLPHQWQYPPYTCRRYEIGDTAVTGIIISPKKPYPETWIYTDEDIGQPFNVPDGVRQLVKSDKYWLSNHSFHKRKPNYTAMSGETVFRLRKPDGSLWAVDNSISAPKSARGRLLKDEKVEYKQMSAVENGKKLRREQWLKLHMLLDAAAIGRPIESADTQGHDNGEA